jgi:hypothetical protein
MGDDQPSRTSVPAPQDEEQSRLKSKVGASPPINVRGKYAIPFQPRVSTADAPIYQAPERPSVSLMFAEHK